MEQVVSPDTEQVREGARAVVEVLREPCADEVSPSEAVNSSETEALRGEIIRVGRKLWER